MLNTRIPSNAAPDLMVDELCMHLEALRHEHDALLALTRRRREAIAGAKHAAMVECVGAESVVAQRIGAIEQRREPVVEGLVRLLGGPPAGAPRFWRANSEWIADRLAARGATRQAERVRRIAGEVRALIMALREENASAQAAAQVLAKHLQGIIRTVDQRLSASGAYTPRGVVAAAPSTLCGVDITS